MRPVDIAHTDIGAGGDGAHCLACFANDGCRCVVDLVPLVGEAAGQREGELVGDLSGLASDMPDIESFVGKGVLLGHEGLLCKSPPEWRVSPRSGPTGGGLAARWPGHGRQPLPSRYEGRVPAGAAKSSSSAWGGVSSARQRADFWPIRPICARPARGLHRSARSEVEPTRRPRRNRGRRPRPPPRSQRRRAGRDPAPTEAKRPTDAGADGRDRPRGPDPAGTGGLGLVAGLRATRVSAGDQRPAAAPCQRADFWPLRP